MRALKQYFQFSFYERPSFKYEHILIVDVQWICSSVGNSVGYEHWRKQFQVIYFTDLEFVGARWNFFQGGGTVVGGVD